MNKNWQDLRRFLGFLVKRFREDRCELIASSLTFTTLLSLVPLIAIALMIFSTFPIFDDFSAAIRNFLVSNLMPAASGKVISQYVERFAKSALHLTPIGIAFLALTAMLMIHTIEDAFKTIWRVSKPRALTRRIVVYCVILTLGPLLVGGSLSVTSWLTGMSAGYAKQVPALVVDLLKMLPVLLTTLAFSLMFRVVPNRFVPWRHAVIGGVVASVMFELMNHAFAYYIAHFPTYKQVYGTFASIPIFLMWIYLSWLAILFGALITASLSHWRTGHIRHDEPVVQLYCAMRILKAMDEGMRSGTVQTLTLLSGKLSIGFDVLEQILDKLERANLVRKVAKSGFMLVRNTGNMHAAELYRLFVYDDSVMAAQGRDAQIDAWLLQMGLRMAENGDVSLRDLFATTGNAGTGQAQAG